MHEFVLSDTDGIDRTVVNHFINPLPKRWNKRMKMEQKDDFHGTEVLVKRWPKVSIFFFFFFSAAIPASREFIDASREPVTA